MLVDIGSKFYAVPSYTTWKVTDFEFLCSSFSFKSLELFYALTYGMDLADTLPAVRCYSWFYAVASRPTRVTLEVNVADRRNFMVVGRRE